MLEFTAFLLALVVGLPCAALFFWGLAWSMRKALASTQPALWFLVSFSLRSAAMVLVALLLIRWLEPLSALLGLMLAFMLVRVLSVYWVKKCRASPPQENR